MPTKREIAFAVLSAALAIGGLAARPAVARQESSGTAASASPAPAKSKAEAADAEVKQLLLLMDTDKNGKISRKEFMNFMQKEFNRLDIDKNGELDVKELTQEAAQPLRSFVVGPNRPR